jgi:hypothetical protein
MRSHALLAALGICTPSLAQLTRTRPRAPCSRGTWCDSGNPSLFVEEISRLRALAGRPPAACWDGADSVDQRSELEETRARQAKAKPLVHRTRGNHAEWGGAYRARREEPPKRPVLARFSRSRKSPLRID